MIFYRVQNYRELPVNHKSYNINQTKDNATKETETTLVKLKELFPEIGGLSLIEVKNWLETANLTRRKKRLWQSRLPLEDGVSCFYTIDEAREYYREFTKVCKFLVSFEGEFLCHGEDGEPIARPSNLLSVQELPNDFIKDDTICEICWSRCKIGSYCLTCHN